LDLAYAHVMLCQDESFDAFALARENYNGKLIINDGFDGDGAAVAISEGIADAVSFGRHFIANPDYVRRVKEAIPLTKFDRKTLYTTGSKGYSDYPVAR